MAMQTTTSQPAPDATQRGAGDPDYPVLEYGRSTPGTVDANTALGDRFNTRVRSNARGEVWTELSKQTPPNSQFSELSTLLPPDVMRVLQKTQNERDAANGMQSNLCIMSGGSTQTFDFSGMSHEERIAAASDAVKQVGIGSTGTTTIKSTKSTPFPPDFDKVTLNEVYHLYGDMAKHTLKYKSKEEHKQRIMEHLPAMLNTFNNLTTREGGIGTFFFNVKTAILLSNPEIADPLNPRSEFVIKLFGEDETGHIAAIYERRLTDGVGDVGCQPFNADKAVTMSVALVQAYMEIEKFERLNYTYRMLQTRNPYGRLVHIPSEPTGESIRMHPMWEDFKKMNFTIDYSAGGIIRFRDVSMPDRVQRVGDGRVTSSSVEVSKTHFDHTVNNEDLLDIKEAEEQADRNAADLLSQLDEEEAACKSKSARKAAKNRAAKLRKKKKSTSEADSEQLASIAEEELHVQSETEPQRAGVFNLSDIGSALTPKEDDAATSVATALMCVFCMSYEKSIACVPCGHKCLCEACGAHEVVGDKCPMCREPIAMFMRVFE
jgi:hypothetical protein